MGIPSGYGSEVLKRVSYHANSNAWRTLITGEADHIYTVISLVAAEQNSAALAYHIRVDISAAGSNHIMLTNAGWLPLGGVFVFNDKIVLTGTDKLEVWNNSGDVDWYVSYIEQDWE